jgi:ribosomal-protein-alanine N-acetyltransferase
MKHLGTCTLNTNRLILRRFREDDAQMMFDNWAHDPEVTRYLTWPPHDSAETSKYVLSDWISRYAELDFYVWAITSKQDGDMPIGSISVVHKSDGIEMVHIGYCIGRAWWGNGITSEALDALIRFFFNEVRINRIEARHDPRNPNSGKVMRKCGMKYEGTMRESDRNNQGVCDAAMYAILAKDFYAEDTLPYV